MKRLFLCLLLAVPAVASEKSVPDLIQELSSDQATVRIAAADELARRGFAAKEALRPLLKAMEGKSAWVDFAMMEAVGAMGEPVVPMLIAILEDPKDELRMGACRGLWMLGPEARAALPALQRVLAENGTNRVHQTVPYVIEKIEAELKAATTGTASAAAPGATGLLRPELPTGRGDWPQFHGPGRDSLCAETGLLTHWPPGGPKLLWKLEGLGRGFSTVAIAGGRLFTLGDRATGQFALAYDLATRRELWATRIGDRYPEYGPLGVPTVDGDMTFALGTDGNLFALDTATGAPRWQKSLTNDFVAPPRIWRFSESPLVDGDRLICTPGGTNVVMAALDKRTGAVLWKCAAPDLGSKGKDGAGYSSAVAAEIGGVRQYVQVTGRGVIGVSAETGKFLWGYNRIANNMANITAPIVRGNEVFVANSYSSGSTLLRIHREGEAFRAEEVYFLAYRDFENHHGGIVRVGDYVFGGSGLDRGDPACVHWPTGKIMWKQRGPVSGSAGVLYVDGHLLFRYDRGPVYLLEANPSELRVKASFRPLTADGPAWAHPVIHDKKLYLRHNDLLACYDLGR